MTMKSVIGYMMQREEVRRWNLAQMDLRICFHLVRATLLMLAAAGLHRSVDTVIYVAAGTFVLVLGSLLLLFIGGMVIFSLVSALKKWSGPGFPYSYLSLSLAWAEWTVTALVIVLLATLGYASINYEPFLALWTEPPDHLDATIFVFTTIVVVVSIKFQSYAENRLFARPLPKLTKRPDGTIGVSFPK